MTEDQIKRVREFISNLPLLQSLGWNCWIPLVHAWHESGAFAATSDDKKNLLDGFNFWGIKKRKSWTGPTVEIVTHEWMPHRENPEIYKQDPDFIKVDRVTTNAKGKLVDYIMVKSRFMAFNSCKEAVLWYDDFIANSPNYKDAYSFRSDPSEFFVHLVDQDEPGELPYSTNPNYPIEVMGAMARIKGNQIIQEMMRAEGVS